MKSHKTPWRNVMAIFIVAMLILPSWALVPSTTVKAYSFSVYGVYEPGHNVYAVDGYGDLLYYDDGTGVCHIVKVTIPEGADPNDPDVPRYFEEIGAHDFAADCGWSAKHQAEFYVDENYIYYGPGSKSGRGIEKWAKTDGTFGDYKGKLEIPVLRNGETLAYDANNDIWYSCTSSRDVYSFRMGADTEWQYEFTYPSYGTGQGHHGGMEFVGGYLWVSEMKTDCIGQWKYTGTGDYNGWQEIDRFSYTHPAYVEGLGFGPLGHFWASAGSWGTKTDSPPIYEIGGGPAKVVAAFTWTPEPQNEGEPIVFLDDSTSWPDDIVSLSWDFGDGGTSTLQNPAHAYGDNGTYTVSLTITTRNGLQDTVSHNVVIDNVPPSVEAGPDQEVNEGETVSFSGSFTDPGWLDTHAIGWDFGDGSTASGTLIPTHAYGDNGSYTVTLTVTDDDGGVGTDTLTVTVLNVPPTAQAGPDQEVNEGETVSFSGSFTDPGSLDTHTIGWDFGDGSTASGTFTPNHAYGDNGSYTVTLTVTDDDGGVGTDTLTVTVLNVQPGIGAISYEAKVDEGNLIEGSSITFTATATDPGTDDLTFAWHWGDGTQTTVTTYYNDGVNPDPDWSPWGTYPFSATDTVLHTYGDNAVYPVTLTVIDDDEGVTTVTITITVLNGEPTIEAISYEAKVDEGNLVEGSPITFTATATDPGTDDLTFTWDWGDGTQTTVTPYYNDGVNPDPDWSPWGTYPFSATDTVQHTYGDNAVYPVTLTVIDDDGGEVTLTIPVTVNNVVPAVEPNGPYSGYEGSPITFTATATDPGTDDLTLTWDWGDGTQTTVTTYYNDGIGPDPCQSPWGTYPFSATDTVQHTYGDNGTYTVTLAVTDDDGGIVTNTLTVTVFNVAPTAEAGPNQAGDEEETISFSGSFADPGWLDTHTIEWDLGDGSTASGTLTPTHAYAYKGTYSVTLTVTDDDEGVGKDTLTVYIPLGMTVVVEPGEVPAPSDVQYIPLQNIPLQDIPLQDIPLQDIPLQDISMGATPLQDIPLQDIPLQDIDWNEVLTGTSLEGIPLQDITLGELLLAGIPLQDITLADIFLAGIPLQDISIGAAPLQDIPLQDIPLQDITWESILLGTPLQDIPLQDISLRDLLLAGVPLQDIPLQDIQIVDTPLQYIPLQDIPLQDITWESILMGTELEGTPLQDITLGDLVIHNVPLQDIPLQDILLVRVPLQDIPLQDIPLQDINILGTPLQDIPLQDIPLQDITWDELLAGTVFEGTDLSTTTLGDLALAATPLQDIPLQDIPLQDIPLQDIPLQDITIVGTPLQDIPLQDIPLQDITWESILMDTPLQDIPLQDITLGDLVLAGIPLQDITLQDMFLAGIPLQDIFIGAAPLQDIPLQDIPLQDIPWESILLGTPLQDIPLQDISLRDLLLASVPLQDIPLQDIQIMDTPLRYIPLQDIPLQDITWESILVGTELEGTPLQDITLGDLVIHNVPLQDITLLNILLVSVPLQDIPLQDIPLQDINILGTPLQDIPLQDIPLQDITWDELLAGTVFEGTDLATTTLGDLALAATPLQDITLEDIVLAGVPLQDIPLQDIPLQDITIVGTPLQNIPLQDIPLQDITWESILMDTPLQDIPLQDITLGDLALAGVPLQDITLEDIVLAGVPLQDIPLQDIPILSTPLQDIFLQAISADWTSILAGTVFEGADLATTTLGDIARAYIPLQDITMRDALMALISLQDIPILGTPLQDIPLQDISADPAYWAPILAGTVFEGADLATTTLGDLALADVPLQDITLWDALMALIPLQDIPWESVPLQDIPLQETFIIQNAVTYTITVANYGSVDAENLIITHTLPEGFAYLAGSTSGATTSDPAIEGQNLTWGPFTVPAGTELVLQFKAIAAISLGTYFSDVSATSNLEIPPALDTAPVVVTDTFEVNDSWEQAYEITDDCFYLSYISTETDVDWYKIPVPTAKGTMVTVYLSHLPADYDLVLFAGVEALPTDIPLQDIPLQDIPLQDIPLQDIPLQDIPLQDIPLQDIPLQDIPLQDIPLQDIPLQDISIERGTTDEIAGDKVVNETGYYYILISGYGGAHSDEPYLLRVEVTPPPGVEPYSRVLPPPGPAGELYEPYGQDAETLIVTNQQRLHQYYSEYDEQYNEYVDTAAVDDLIAELKAFADLNNVKGMLIPVDYYEEVRAAYAAWDANVSDPEAANAVAAAIRSVINSALSSHPNVKYVVIVGSDEIIPFCRVPDEVYLSNESTYAAVAHLNPSALYASLAYGYILTDDYYVDTAPVRWMGRELYVPDYAIGRLVETPAEIIGVLNEFEASGGVLEVETALVTGYDFLSDGANEIAAALQDQGLDPAILINEEWTETQLAALLLGDPAYDLNSINAHCNHWQVGPPVGSPFNSSQIPLVSYLEGKLIFSMGCHAGLNVDDTISEDGDWSLDLPQAFAQESAWYVGNTGYGYGDSDIVALSEELMLNFAAALGAEESVPVGQALVNAKQEYFLSMGSYGPFDEKIMIESTLYGLPMYQVQVVPFSLPVEEGIPLVIEANRLVNFGLVDSLTEEAQLVAVITEDGIFYSADGETQFIPYRPIQPQASMEISYLGQVAHGALFMGGTYVDNAGFDPVIARPIYDQSLYEPQIINEAWYPAKLQTIISLQTPDGVSQVLAVVPGQFITTSSDPQVIGIERLYTSLDYDIYYSTSQDYTPPIIELADIVIRGTTAPFTTYFSVEVSDANDPAIPDDGRVRRVVVTWTYTTGDTTWETIDLQYDATSGTWIGELPGLTGAETDFIVQAVDAAGNVGLSACKGFFFTPIPVAAGDNQIVDEGDVVSFQGSIGQAPESLNILWDFGDGSTAEGVLNPTHVYRDDGAYTVTFRVTDGKGGSGWDTLEVTVLNVIPGVEVPEGITVQYTDPLELVGSFTDPGSGDTHTYRWDFLADPAGEPLITIWGNLESTIEWLEWLDDYPVPGTYTATLTVMDDDGAVGIGICPVTITKEDTVLSSPMGEMVYSYETTISVSLHDDDGQVLVHQADVPKTVYLEYRLDDVSPWVVISEDVLASADDTDDTLTFSFAIPEDFDEPAGVYELRVRFDGDECYNLTIASGVLAIYIPQYLKLGVLPQLESAKTGDPQIDQEIDRLLQRMQNSLSEDLWLDASHLTHVSGKDVFQEEKVVVEHLLNLFSKCPQSIPIFESIIADLVKSDELLAEIAIEQAWNLINDTNVDPATQQEVMTQIESAEEELAKGQQLAEANPAGAIVCFMHAWEHAQQVVLLLT